MTKACECVPGAMFVRCDVLRDVSESVEISVIYQKLGEGLLVLTIFFFSTQICCTGEVFRLLQPHHHP